MAKIAPLVIFYKRTIYDYVIYKKRNILCKLVFQNFFFHIIDYSRLELDIYRR